MSNYYNEEYFEDKSKSTTTATTTTEGSVFYGILTIMYVIWILLISSIWVIAGILAFIASIACMFYNSSTGDKIAGFFLALFFGPFYWFFYIYKSSYCNSYPAYAPVANYYG
jgi:hypothetical protein